jgi:glutamate dehydrogenase/leucine dehydrogenase
MNTFTDLLNNCDHDIVRTFYCRKLDLFAVIALHKQKSLPAIGGLRFINYQNYELAIRDALNLSQAMTAKSEAHNLGHGGGKMVAVVPKHFNRSEVMQQIGLWVDTLNGKYITASDSGTNSDDMSMISRTTQHVASPCRWPQYNPSYYTALGVYASMLACYSNLKDKTIAIQGVGEVGKYLIEILLDCGAKIIACDSNSLAIEKISCKYNIRRTENIYETECDIFSPCALGAILNPITLPKIKAKFIVGAANNQFANSVSDARLASELGLVYVPDYVANGGGLIHVAGLFANKTATEIERDVMAIQNRAKQFIGTAITV